jgi:hypothetical protein
MTLLCFGLQMSDINSDLDAAYQLASNNNARPAWLAGLMNSDAIARLSQVTVTVSRQP